MQQAVESGMSVLISSLTKAAATEIGGRNLPISFDALGTLHSHCYHALGRPEKPSPRPAALAEARIRQARASPGCRPNTGAVGVGVVRLNLGSALAVVTAIRGSFGSFPSRW